MTSITPSPPRPFSRSRLPFIGFGLVLIVGFVILLSNIWPIGPDYYFTLNRTAVNWTQGKTHLYDDNPFEDVPGNQDIGFFFAPWLLIITVPLSLLPVTVGQAILTVSSILGIMFCLRLLQGRRSMPFWIIILALANLHTFDVLIRGQVDVLVLVGCVLGWWAVQKHRPWLLSLAFTLIAIKPINGVIPALVLLLAILRWPLVDKLKAISLPIVLAILSGFIIGFDWPLRYLVYVKTYLPPNDYLSTSLWRGLSQIGLPSWILLPLAVIAVVALVMVTLRVGINQWVLAIALATNLLFAVYAHDNHYVLLVPAFMYVARRDWRLALLAYLSTLTPLLRLAWGWEAARIDVVYPLILFVSLWWLKLAPARALESQDSPTNTNSARLWPNFFNLLSEETRSETRTV